MFCDDGGRYGDSDIRCICSVRFGCLLIGKKGIFDDREHSDGSGTRGGLGAFSDELSIFVEHQRALDGDGVFLEIDAIPSQGGDFRTAKTATGSKVDGDLHVGVLSSVDHGPWHRVCEARQALSLPFPRTPCEFCER